MLADQAEAAYSHLSAFAKAAIEAVAVAIRPFGGRRYRHEIGAWAKALDRTPGSMTLLNYTYEMSYAENMSVLPFGCTAGVKWVPGMGMVHVRNLDWPLYWVGPATNIMEYKNGKHPYTTVGVAGLVGALSGMVPGAYSVTVNHAPAVGRINFKTGPLFLLRQVLETCDTYDKAVHKLSCTKLAVPVFFTVCGAARGQACVIERTQSDAAIREFDKVPLVQSNDFTSDKFSGIGAEDYGTEDSRVRSLALAGALADVGHKGLKEIASCLDIEPVLNIETQQQMAFCPATGEMQVWRRDS